MNFLYSLNHHTYRPPSWNVRLLWSSRIRATQSFHSSITPVVLTQSPSVSCILQFLDYYRSRVSRKIWLYFWIENEIHFTFQWPFKTCILTVLDWISKKYISLTYCLPVPLVVPPLASSDLSLRLLNLSTTFTTSIILYYVKTI